MFYLHPMVKNYIVVEESRRFRTHCIHFDWMPPAPAHLKLSCHITNAAYETLSSLFAKCHHAYLNKSLVSEMKLKAAF